MKKLILAICLAATCLTSNAYDCKTSQGLLHPKVLTWTSIGVDKLVLQSSNVTLFNDGYTFFSIQPYLNSGSYTMDYWYKPKNSPAVDLGIVGGGDTLIGVENASSVAVECMFIQQLLGN